MTGVQRQVYSIRFKKSAIDQQILQYGRKLDEQGARIIDLSPDGFFKHVQAIVPDGIDVGRLDADKIIESIKKSSL
ncbi:hypothetical protein WALSEDRAFT_65065 [Wallemia mellicola CBS 633.66]|uniref:Uncharacterized protein n=2 Tax=Wallemia mellicola TaxID=1708541 RepID=A0A4T0QSJ0_9BASI|nr:hypothetical protein WALSEDRAFT_65065 [Wallemia mellicola CBS 633.66]TIB72333.1 hypothetical protein E3Q23_03421 [Wallemia mellicola]EIM20907.1 hypothetical protein WALSEDRAFT_65065 [Wallemia mellicola CBS 633.66]TIB95699.1 hypothetical protein E3Q18_03572 [Wallemia mellicola]TIC27996.1 hypothetical protein E3Q10_03453 [Wallemia mellicola]TIC63406.1 hypothetical protein E3Q01_03383 [Wallemia mellicola]|eukprot:XP_006959166.1 hypothetical protein WALSEDRAFT_65065 [Wallemia mellicola CBS 633.66]